MLGDDGQIWAQCTDPNTGETFLTQDLDATPILDQFVLEHPDFSLNGAKAIFSLTGYQGILGYRTQNDIDIAADDPRRPAFDANRQAEIEAVKPVIERLKETGWTFGSHTWSHIRLDSRPLESVQRDTVRWAEEVGSLVGPTNILFYPHGGRPDGDDWPLHRPVFQYLQSQASASSPAWASTPSPTSRRTFPPSSATGSTPTAPPCATARPWSGTASSTTRGRSLISMCAPTWAYLVREPTAAPPVRPMPGGGVFFGLTFPGYRGSIITLYRGWERNGTL